MRTTDTAAPIIVSGEWLMDDAETARTGEARYRLGFEVAELHGRYSYGVDFLVNRKVAAAIVDWQARFNADGYTGADTLEWDGDAIVQRSPENDPDYEGRIEPDARGLYAMGCGWTWSIASAGACATVVRQDETPRHRREYETDGVAKAECLKCGHVEVEPGDLDLWNGYGDCPKCHAEGPSLWTDLDGTEVLCDGHGPERLLDADTVAEAGFDPGLRDSADGIPWTARTLAAAVAARSIPA